jgi:hypothetical protein
MRGSPSTVAPASARSCVMIAGSNRPNVPAWVAGASSLSNASSLCSSSFTGGPVWLVQFFNRTLNYDQDYACP